MNIDDLKMMVSEYIDGELKKEKEPILFTALSDNEELREFFKNMQSIKTVVDDSTEEFPQELEERIFYSIGEKEKKSFFGLDFLKGNRLGFLAYSFSVLLMFLTFYFYFETKEYKHKVDNIMNTINRQNKTIEILMDSRLPDAIIPTDYINEVIVKPKS